jgi:hypothetical protein
MRVIAACYQTAGEPAKDKPARTSRAQDLALGPDNAGIADVDQVERGAFALSRGAMRTCTFWRPVTPVLWTAWSDPKWSPCVPRSRCSIRRVFGSSSPLAGHGRSGEARSSPAMANPGDAMFAVVSGSLRVYKAEFVHSRAGWRAVSDVLQQKLFVRFTVQSPLAGVDTALPEVPVETPREEQPPVAALTNPFVPRGQAALIVLTRIPTPSSRRTAPKMTARLSMLGLPVADSIR